ncbi:MAG: hypothetical protein RLZZ248_1292 [Bacteroidota bacterium]
MTYFQKLVVYCWMWVGLVSCVAENQAEQVILQSIKAHGFDDLDQASLEFTFRNRGYTYWKKEGRFEYKRIQRDSLMNEIVDLLDNDGLTRYKNEAIEPLNAKDSAAYASSVNSVIYFALLPYFLKDPAVQTSYLGIRKIGDKEYHKIKVGFEVEGGGKDFQDEFVYWFDTNTYLLDYLAYNYLTDGGGARFRKVTQRIAVGSYLFNQYDNLKPVPASMEVEKFDVLYEAGKLQYLSTIVLEEIKIH